MPVLVLLLLLGFVHELMRYNFFFVCCNFLINWRLWNLFDFQNTDDSRIFVAVVDLFDHENLSFFFSDSFHFLKASTVVNCLRVELVASLLVAIAGSFDSLLLF